MQPCYPSDLPGVTEPQCDVYALWHVCRSVERVATVSDLDFHKGIRTIEFRVSQFSAGETMSFAVKSPPSITPPEAVCFWGCPLTQSKCPDANKVFRSIRPRLEQLLNTPASPGEFEGNSVLACESLGHRARISACVELENPTRRHNLIRRAIFMYEATLRMTAHTTVVQMLDRIGRHPDEVYVVRTNDNMASLSVYTKRLICSAFSGLALCYLYLDNFTRFGSFSSLVVGWDDIGGIFSLNTIRVIAALDGKLDMFLFVTQSVLMPYLVRTGRRFVLHDELEYCTHPSQRHRTLTLVLGLADRFSMPSPPAGMNVRTRIINGVVIERVCALCSKKECKLSHCSKCRAVYYCSKECQKADWGRHKAECDSDVVELTWKKIV